MKAALNENAHSIIGTICSIRTKKIKNPIFKQVRYLDKSVYELAKGKELYKIERK